MNEHEFESRLQRTPLKSPPVEWRGEILPHVSDVAADACRREAQRSLVNRRTSPARELKFAAIWKARLRELFWPHPVAWGAIAGAWIAIGVLSAASATNEHRPTAVSGTFYVVWQSVLLGEDPWQEASLNQPAPNASPQTNSQIAPRSQATADWRTI